MLSKKYLIVILNICLLSCTNKRDNISFKNLNSTYFIGKPEASNLYIRVENDSAFLYHLYEDLMPRFNFKDTLSFNQDSIKWVGSESLIYLKNNKMIAKTNSMFDEGSFLKCRIKQLSLDEWLKKYNYTSNWNLYTLENQRFIYDTTYNLGVSERLVIWHKINSKYQLDLNQSTEEYFVLFQKFKEELLLEIKK